MSQNSTFTDSELDNDRTKLMSVDKTLTQLKQQGFRSTKIRRALLEILWSETCLLSTAEIQNQLIKQKLKPNRSTLYRELKFLSNQQIITQQSIGNQDLYELIQDHHHHLICDQCGLMTRFELANHLQSEEKKVEKQSGFKIFRHELEFYGVCQKCQKKAK